MNVLYINLDRDVERRIFFEENFARYNSCGWVAQRFAAVDKATIPDGRYGPTMTKGAVALSITHRRAIQKSVGMPGHLLLAEDDILFGPNSQAVINKCIGGMSNQEWDILFTDICVPVPFDMLKILHMKRKCRGSHTVINLKGMVFGGTAGLVINERAKQKYLKALTDEALFAEPIDLLIRRLAADGKLNVYCTFPFATSLSHHADSSSIQEASVAVENHLWNAFRRAIWTDQDLDVVNEDLGKLPGVLFDPQAQAVARIAAALIVNATLNRTSVEAG